MPKFIVTGTDSDPSAELSLALCKAAGLRYDRVSRIVLDLKVGSAGRVYFETFADGDDLKVGLPDGFVIEAR